MKSVGIAKKERADGQLTGLAGEFFVAAELLKRGLQVSITLGNAKQVDLVAFNPKKHQSYTVQVKALRRPNYFPISANRVHAAHVYVFVILNKVGESPTYFCVPGNALAETPERFEKWFVDPKFPGIRPKALIDFQNWDVFEQPYDSFTGYPGIRS